LLIHMKKLRVLLLGTRGIPARYGGFETFVEELGARLSDRGHAVVVHSRRPFFARLDNPSFVHRGVRVRAIPTIMHKYLETPLHSLMSFLSLRRFQFDVILLCNAANSPFAWIGRLRGVPVAINVDGIERMRTKWNFLGKLWYALGERCSVLFASEVIADAKVIAEYYRERYKAQPTVITYGATAVQRPPGSVLEKFNLEPGKYLLYVSRLEPENNALGVIKAYNSLKTDMPLVIVGDAPYAREYAATLRKEASDGVVFTGFQFGEAYQEFQSNCYLYIQATEVGGTHPALIEAMSYGNCVVANGTPENHEVLSDAGFFYSKNNFEELSVVLAKLLSDVELVREYGGLAKERAESVYTWDKITDQYEVLFRELTGR